MQPGYRVWLLCLVALWALSGCDAGVSESDTGSIDSASGATGNSGQSGSGSAPSGLSPSGSGVVPGTKDTVVTTTSVAGTVSVAVGASRTITVVFNSSDGRQIKGLGISGTTLPTGWSGPDNHSCTLVGAGSSCVTNLTYSPVAVESGTLTLNYIYINNANEPQAPGGSVTIPYNATTHNNVVAAGSPIGQVSAAMGSGSQPVRINFTTDDGNAATDLVLTTDLTTLPSAWSSSASSFSCAIVSTGSGCQLALSYVPLAAGTGVLALNYGYNDDSGVPRSGTLNVPYATTANGNVVASVSPTGQINAVQKAGRQAVSVTFNTDDGKTATRLSLLSNLKSLPKGWTSASSAFSCGSVSTGNGCQLSLAYAPIDTKRGTLILDYDYLDATGTYNVGTANVEFAGTTDDNVVGTAAPSGQINAIVGLGSQPVAVTFTTDDTRPATALQLTSNLNMLPAGWSTTASSFACSGLSTGNGCQLNLTYAPAAADSGAVPLSFGYRNNAGEFKTASVDIPYRATTDDNVFASANPNPLSVIIGSNTVVTVTFTTDDGNLASNLSVTSGLSTLPAGWTVSSGSFNCPSVSTGSTCQLSLGYAPAMADSGTLTLPFSYTNNSGMVKSGSAVISYTASP